MIKKLCMSAALLSGLAMSPALAQEFTITSSDIAEGQQLDLKHVYQGFGCTGGNIAPTLSWSNAPAGTKSFAITAYDPDAPTGSGWWHWFAFNIPANVTTVGGNTGMPAGTIELNNDYGAKGFGGACPPPGEVHRYQFSVHALGNELNIDANVSNALAGFMVKANSLASDTITAVYNR